MKKLTYLLSSIVLGTLMVTTSAFAEGEGKDVDHSVKWTGDVRIRHEVQSSDEVISGSSTTQKIAFRVGGKAAANEDADIEFRFATGTGRVSTNQDLGKNGTTANSGFANTPILLDRAFFNWHGVSGLNAYAGRVKNTFTVAGGNDLMFDTDLNFDGTALNYKLGEESLQPFIGAHYYWVNKSTTTATQDNHLVAGQIGVQGKQSSFDFLVHAGMYHYDHMQGQAVIGAAKGNSTSAGLYTQNFHLIEGGLEVSFKVTEKSNLAVYADYVKNAAADRDGNAYIAGLKFGKAKKKGDLLVSYDYRMMDRDALVGAFTDGDSANGAGANSKSHRVKACYEASDGLCIGGSASFGKKNLATGQTEAKSTRYIADLQYTF